MTHEKMNEIIDWLNKSSIPGKEKLETVELLKESIRIMQEILNREIKNHAKPWFIEAFYNAGVLKFGKMRFSNFTLSELKTRQSLISKILESKFYEFPEIR